jgi:UPF0755 protein
MARKFNAEKKAAYQREQQAAGKITRWIGSTLIGLLVLILIVGGLYVHHAMQPVDRHSYRYVAVNIPVGATNREIADILQEKHVIHSAKVFNLWLKVKSESNFQAGKFYVSPSMNTQQIVRQLQGSGSRPISGYLLVREGETIDQIGTAIAKSTNYSKKDFLALMKNQKFINKLAKKYPKLLTSSMKSKHVRYHLEGYLFPARYEIYRGASLKELVEQMVAKTNQVLLAYYSQIKRKGLTVHQVLTLASLVEREGVKTSDRRKIAGVFFNRLDAKMPLQSDISVMYALNKHKHSLTIKDTKVKSPYNLYKHKGYGPGPFNSPSLNSISAVLHPADRSSNYLYFVADLKTGKVYYSHTLNQHLKRNASLGQ